MRRRLTLALVGIALASIFFVGAGVLLLAQIGARDDAIAEMSEGLTAVSEIDFSDNRGPTNLDRLRTALDFDQLGFVFVTDSGELRAPRGAASRAGLTLRPLVSLNTDQVARLRNSEQVFVDLEGLVVGLQAIELRTGPADATPALIATSPVATIGGAARGWFVISAAGVLVLAAVVGSWLAARFTRPIALIEEATRSIAGGNLDTRVEVTGNDELAQLGGSVNTMASDLARSRELEQQFLMSVTHDLRTPLTAIEGYAEALTDGAVDDPVKTGEVISNHADRLDRLVNDLLDLARLQARQFKMELTPVDPAVTVGRTAAGLVPDALDRGVQLVDDIETGSTVMADADRLSQVVGNLIDNALKYAESTVKVSVAPFLTEAGQSVVRISVSDDGPGIPAEDLPRVFERLYVTQQKPKREEASSGLGLAIVRELTHAMGGTISVTSEVGKGTKMTVDLPAR